MNKKLWVAILLTIIVLTYYGYQYFNSSVEENIVSVKAPVKDPVRGSFVAEIDRVLDGDTMIALYDENELIIRLAHIDAPEKGQFQSSGSMIALSGLVNKQEVIIEWKGEKDQYGRYLATVKTAGGVNVNKEMVQQGWAWHYEKYSDDITYDSLQGIAQDNKWGIWQEETPTPPWEWREKNH